MRILRHYPLCPFSRSIRLLLMEKQLDVSMDIEPFWEKRSEFMELNSLGEVPVLTDLNGTVICHALPIFEYLEEAYPQRTPLSLKQKSEIRRLCVWGYGKLAMEVTWPLLMEKHLKRFYNTISDGAVLRTAKKQLPHFLEYLLWLIEHRNWMGGDSFSFADMFLGAQISVLDYMGDMLFESFTPLKEWYMRLKSRPSFKPLLLDRVSGFIPSPHYANLDF